MEDAYKSLHDFMKAGVRFPALLEYCILLAVSLSPVVTPISIFVSTIFTANRLLNGNEIVAMECAGMNILEIHRPVIICCAILAVVTLFLETLVVPGAIDYVATFRAKADAKVGSATRVVNVGLDNRRDHRMWFFKVLDKLSYAGNDVTVNCYGADGGERSRIFAKEARFDAIGNHWKFFRGSATSFDPISGLTTVVEPFAERDFVGLTEHPKVIIASEKKPKNLSFSEVLDATKYCGEDFVARTFLVKFHGTFAGAARCLVVLFFAIPLPMDGPCGGTFRRIARSFWLFLLFLVSDVIFSVLGKNGALSPPIAAWGASLLVIFPLRKLFREAV
jgi:lipopolysaccharide export LptBFGC system permease protein LptF